MAKDESSEDATLLCREVNRKSPRVERSYSEIISTKGVSVVWKNLCVRAISTKQNFMKSATTTTNEIIRNVDGCIKPKSLVAIMGASGSGKSTLMSVLAYRQPGNLATSGDIRINGQHIRLKYMKRISGYVYQDDLFIATLTVSEHMHFAFKLKQDRRISESRRKEIINGLLMDVGLLHCANRRIGSIKFGKGEINLSGGEQKRLSVATELLTDPSLLFCDEPTTGLDSFSAMNLVSVLRNLTEQKHKTIVCSIHQPSEQLFDLFHQVILLCRGRVAFSGTPAKAIEFFKSLSFKYAEDRNPAEFLINCVAIAPGQHNETEEQAVGICKQFDNSRYAEEIREYIQSETPPETVSYPKPRRIETSSWLYLFYLMAYRDILTTLRDPTLQGMNIINKSILAVVLGLCFKGSVTLTQAGMQSLKGVIFILVSQNVSTSVFAFLKSMPRKMPIFMREYRNNINSSSLCYFSNVVSLTPGLVVEAVLFGTIMYLICGLRSEFEAYLWTLAIVTILLNISCAFGTLLSVAMSFETAHLVANPLNLAMIQLSGLFINLRTVPIFLYWVRYVSWVTLAVESLLMIQLHGVEHIACDPNPIQPCFSSGEEILDQLDFNESHFSSNIITMLLIYVILHVSGFLIFYMKVIFRTKSKLIKAKYL